MTKPPVDRKLAVRHLSVRQLVFWLLMVSSFACMDYKHAVAAAFHIYAQRGEVVAKRRCSHGNYIVDHGKSWNCVLNFCGNNPEHFI